MSKASEILREMMLDPTGASLLPVRKTTLTPQADGSILRRVTGQDGHSTEDSIPPKQRLSLDARTRLGLSQQEFAALLGISVRTLHDWEQGRRDPSATARTLLKIVARHPEIVREAVAHPA